MGMYLPKMRGIQFHAQAWNILQKCSKVERGEINGDGRRNIEAPMQILSYYPFSPDIWYNPIFLLFPDCCLGTAQYLFSAGRNDIRRRKEDGDIASDDLPFQEKICVILESIYAHFSKCIRFIGVIAEINRNLTVKDPTWFVRFIVSISSLKWTLRAVKSQLNTF